MAALATPVIVALFALAGGLVWWAGSILSPATDAIDAHFGWGEGMGGALLLAVATSLPEIAIVAGGAFTNNMSVAAGNILGGIAIQTVVLVLLDGPGLRGKRPLTATVSSLTIVLEGLILVAILMFCIIGALSPPSLVIARMTPVEIAILLTWAGGLWAISHNEERKAWRVAREEIADVAPVVHPRRRSIRVVFAFFGFAALLTLAGGIVLELTSTVLADRMHLHGVLFGATVLSAVTALPEVTTGLYAVRAGRYELAMSDVVGSNAFLPVLFLPATLLSGKAVLPDAQGPDLYLAALGALLTAVYCIGTILRSGKLLFGAGVDSVIVFILYVVGIAGLFFVTR